MIGEEAVSEGPHDGVDAGAGELLVHRSTRELAPNSADVARLVVARLLRDGYTAGDRLPSERQLAVELGVGRSVIREALRSLSLLGVLDLRRGDGTYLSESSTEPIARAAELGPLIGPGRLHDLSSVSTRLEAAVAGLAADRRTDASLRAMDANQDALERSYDLPQEMVNLHRHFHGLVWEAASNHALAQILGSICSLLDHALGRAVAQESDHTWIIVDHRKVLEAIRFRDRASAGAAMEAHMITVSDRLAAVDGATREVEVAR